MPETTSAPIFDKIFSTDIEGTPTDIVYHRFANKICLFITQYEKINNLYTVSVENVLNPASGPMGQKSDIEITHCFGKDTDEYTSGIRYLVERVPALVNGAESLVINFGLKEVNRKVLQSLENILTVNIV